MTTTNPHNVRTARRPADRRGVLILVVLSMLVLFSLLILTFVIVASQHRRSLRAASRQEQYGNNYGRQLDEAMYQLVRDTTNPTSALLEQSLLNDLYGNDAVTGKVTTFSGQSAAAQAVVTSSGTPTTTQFIDVTVKPDILPSSGTPFLPPPGTMYWDPTQTTGYYNGCVFTPTNGALAGHSTRVVGSSYNTTLNAYVVRLLVFDNDPSKLPVDGDKFRINGRPLNGMGFGYDNTLNDLECIDTGLSTLTGNTWTSNLGSSIKPYVALLPNRSAYLSSGPFARDYSTTIVPISSSVVPSGSTGYTESADEDYDAPDLQNMFLARVPGVPLAVDLTAPPPAYGYAPVAVLPDNGFGLSKGPVLPSFHRPELLQYWVKQMGATYWYELPGELLQRVLLRPITIYSYNQHQAHSTWFPYFQYTSGGTYTYPTDPELKVNTEFTGSNSAANPNFTPPSAYSSFAVNGPWDVDNDGDGVPDSVWVDLGMPWQTAPNGKQYKPLFAILCVDLDGRLNVNAQGSQADTDSYQTNFSSSNVKNLPWAGLPAGTAPTVTSFGSGYGPADVNLGVLFGATPTNCKYLFNGDSAGLYVGRYGLVTGSPPVAYPGANGSLDTLSAVKWFDYPPVGNYVAPPGVPSAFSTPPDHWGYGFVGLDVRGMPLMTGTGVIGSQTAPPLINSNDTQDSPYELNLSRAAVRDPSTAQVDNPFTPAELERVLRIYDSDSGTSATTPRDALPDRLRYLLESGGITAAAVRNLITTDSYDLPCPGVNIPPSENFVVRNMVNTYRHGLRNYHSLTTTQGITLSDLLGAQIYDNYGAPGGGISTMYAMAPNQPNISTELQKMLGPELLAGQRLDINRALGNGRDDLVAGVANGAVDDAAEVQTVELIWSTGVPASFSAAVNYTNSYWDNSFIRIPAAMPPLTIDVKRDPTNPTYGVADYVIKHGLSRQMLARQLYVLMMMMKFQHEYPVPPKTIPPNLNLDYDGDGVGSGDKETAYTIAQWAINVVDFYDRDSIMTPFEFDINPFNGWNVDGDASTGNVPADDGVTDKLSERGVVWGCERPELLISETLAWHDRRTEDTFSEGDFAASGRAGPSTTANGPNPGLQPDANFDQRLRPLGYLFVELYNPWTTQNMAAGGAPRADEVPGEFYYDPVNSIYQSGVVLNKRVNGNGTPIWRMVIVRVPTNLVQQQQDLDDPTPPGAPPVIERSVYFADLANPAGLPTDDAVARRYYPSAALQNSISTLMPGRYAVVGSGQPVLSAPPTYVSAVGRKNDGSYTNIRRIVLSPGVAGNQVEVLNNNVPAALPNPNIMPKPEPIPINPIPPPGPGLAQNAIAIVIDSGTNAGGTRTPAGVSPGDRLNVSEPLADYVIPLSTTDAPAGSVLDVPLDAAAKRPDLFGAVDLTQNTTIANYATIHLQRLADPTQNWSAANPYRTVDTMTVDLTTFDGVDATLDPQAGNTNASTLPHGVPSFQRGDNDPNDPSLTPPGNPAGQVNNLWRGEISNIFTTLRPAVADSGATPPLPVVPFVLRHTLGYLNERFGTGATTPASYAGAPSTTPFPWLNWNNRPFVSPMELMLVPKSRSSRLLYDFHYNLSNMMASNPYQTAPTANATTPPTGAGHLLNFYYSPNGVAPANRKPELLRILDYVQVPSRFVGAETWLAPNQFWNSSSSTWNNLMSNWSGTSVDEQSVGALLYPPFNRVSNYHDPGRVNINTIVDQSVWSGVNGVSNGLANPTFPTFTNVQLSRAGSNAASGSYPSNFMNPFRSATGATLMLPSAGPTPTPLPFPPVEVDVTLLRSTSSIGAPPVTPLLNYSQQGPVSTGYDDTTRNPYFRFQTLEKLSNVLTTRSNVYAVWVTMGYFERASDGSGLGAEVGSDSGEVQRHRAFYIYDRTIPVAFEPGKNNNVDKGFLLRRIIE